MYYIISDVAAVRNTMGPGQEDGHGTTATLGQLQLVR